MDFETRRAKRGNIRLDDDPMTGMQQSVNNSQPLMAITYALEILEQLAEALDAFNERLTALEDQQKKATPRKAVAAKVDTGDDATA